MNIIKQFESLINGWDEEGKCGYCWKFVGAGRPDLFNMFQGIEESECCIYVGLFNIKFGTRYKVEENGFSSKMNCILSFEGFIGIPSRLDVQFYNELGNTEEEKQESKWSMINSIKDCLGCDFMEVLCDQNGIYSPTEFTATQKINYQDSNYDGWLIKGQYNY
ncbi:hypothetical protein [Chryseobacterium sp.]|uniref:hypothetical protein n=1 Tax=Chryseobacterium sp. TaxID=1871047 RepID=UPI0028A01DE9|nr:hypothetical protein [Chryseobacterium sp.]